MAKRKAEFEDNNGDNDDQQSHAVFIDTNLDTHIVLLVSHSDTFSLLKEKIMVEHPKYFPDIGEIRINALKVKRRGHYYHLWNSMLVRTAFHKVKKNWFIFADVSNQRPCNQTPTNGLAILPAGPTETPAALGSLSTRFGSEIECEPIKVGGKKKKKSKKNKENMVHHVAVDENDAATQLSKQNLREMKTVVSEQTSLLETKCFVTDQSTATLEPEMVVNKSYGGMQKSVLVVSNGLPSKVDKTSKASGKRKREERDTSSELPSSEVNGKKIPKVVGHHAHEAVAMTTDMTLHLEDISTHPVKDFQEETVELKGNVTSSAEVVNDENGIDNVGQPCVTQDKKTKKVKKGVDGHNKRHPTTSSEVPDILKNDIAPSENESINNDGELDNLKSTEARAVSQVKRDPKMLSQNEPLNLVETERETQKPILESGNTAKKRKTKKSKDSVTEKLELSITDTHQDVSTHNVPKGSAEVHDKCDPTNKSDNRENAVWTDRTEAGKQIVELESMAKKKKGKKVKNSVTENLEMSITDTHQDVSTHNVPKGSAEVPDKCDLTNKIDNTENAVQTDRTEASKQIVELGSMAKKRKGKIVKNSVTGNADLSSVKNSTDGDAIDCIQLKDDGNNPDLADDSDKGGCFSQTAKTRNLTSETGISSQQNNGGEAGDREQTSAESLQPAEVDKPGEDVEIKSDIPKKKTQNKQTIPAQEPLEFVVKEQLSETARDIGIPRMVDIELSTQSDKNGAEQQKTADEGHRKEPIEMPPPEVSAGFIEVRKRDKSGASKQKAKKIDRSSSVDTSASGQITSISKRSKASERTFHDVAQLQGDDCEVGNMGKIGGEPLHPPQVNYPEVDAEIKSDKPKRKTKKKQTVQAKEPPEFPVEDKLAETTVVMVVPGLVDNENKGHHKESTEMLPPEVSIDLAEVRKRDKSGASKQKVKEIDLPSSVDTSASGHNMIMLKKSKASVRTSPDVTQLFGDDRGVQNFRPSGAEPFHPPQGDKPEENVEIKSDKPNKKTQKKETGAEDPPGLPLKQHSVEKASKSAVPKSGDGGLLANSIIRDSEDQSKVSLVGEKLGDISPPEVSSGLGQGRNLSKPRANKQETKKLDVPSSVDTSSNELNLIKSKKIKTLGTSQDGTKLQKSTTEPKHNMRQLNVNHPRNSKEGTERSSKVATFHSLKGSAIRGGITATRHEGSKSSGASSVSSGSSVRRTHQEKKVKEPPKKPYVNHLSTKRSSHKNMGEVVNVLAQRKSLLAASGTIFDDASSSSSESEDKMNGSDSSTRTPSDNLSLSDYSEGESKGDVITSRDTSKGGRVNNSDSNVKKLTIESVLRSSRRYRNAKLVASQSQLEDTESQPVEFVPDSQAIM